VDTVRKIISDIAESVQANTLDGRISFRYIYSIVQDKTRTFIKQDSDARLIFKISEVWKRIPCLELEEIDLMECGFDIPHCRLLMKSKLAIPEVFQSKYGNMLKVLTINGQKELKQTTFHDYIDIQRREWKNPNIIYFILFEGHIFVPDSEIEDVTVLGLFKHPYEVTRIVEPDSNCLSILDEPAPVPDYILDIVKMEAKKEIAELYRRIPRDEVANNNTNIK
jgi:hypothetical protein